MADEEKVVEEKTYSENVQKIIDAVKDLKVTELAELIHGLEDTFGVSAQAPVAVAAPAAAGGAAPAEGGAAEEQTEFDVILKDAGQAKIQVIKVVKTITGQGLKEAKELVDGAPKAVKEGISKEEAEKIAKQIEEAGGVVEIK